MTLFGENKMNECLNILVVSRGKSLCRYAEERGDINIYLLEEPTVAAQHDENGAEVFNCIRSHIRCSYQVSDEYLTRVANEWADIKFDCVLPCNEYAVPAAMRLAQNLGLPNLGINAGTLFANKLAMRKHLIDSKVSQPTFAQIDNYQQLQQFAKLHPTFILKPINRHASLGVTKVTPETDLKAVYQDLSHIDEGVRYIQREEQDTFIAETMISGPEFSVEAFVLEGKVQYINVTQKLTTQNLDPKSSYFVEVGHVIPAQISAAEIDLISQAKCELIKHTQAQTGILHSEWILSEGQAYFIECAGRMPGDNIFEMNGYVHDFDPYNAYLTTITGQQFVFPQTASRVVQISFFTPPLGEVKKVSGEEQLQAMAERGEIIDWGLTISTGEKIQEMSSSWARVGHFIASAQDPKQLSKIVTDAYDCLTFEMA